MPRPVKPMCDVRRYLFQCLLAQDVTCLPQNRKPVAAIHGEAREGTCKVCSVRKLEVSSAGTILILCFNLQHSLKVSFQSAPTLMSLQMLLCAAIGQKKCR